MKGSKLLIACAVVMLVAFSFAQQRKSKGELQKDQKKIERDLKIATEALKEASKQQEVTFAKINATKRLIAVRKALINSLDKEIALIQEDATAMASLINAMEHDLDSLQKEFGEMVYQASKVSSNLNELTLVFSSKSYNELRMRLRFLQDISEAREVQVRRIREVKEDLESRNQELQKKFDEKKKTLAKLKGEKRKLEKLKLDQDKLVLELRGKEKDIRKRIKRLEKDKARVKKLIEDLLAREPKGSKELSSKFELNKGRLPWPVGRCFVAHKFGKQRHPEFEDIWINNLGVGLQSPQTNAEVKAVFEGSVVSVASVPGVGQVVMLRHGTYFTVYSGLKTVSVKSGDHVTTRQTLGTVRKNIEGVELLEFQIWKGKKPVNPQPWLSK